MKHLIKDMDFILPEEARLWSMKKHEESSIKNHERFCCYAHKRVFPNNNTLTTFATFYMDKTDTITCEMCKNLANEVDERTGEKTLILEFNVAYDNLDQVGEEVYAYNWCTKAKYNVELNRLIIYRIAGYDSIPIYLNNNGVISRNECALADCGVDIFDRPYR